jgi:hypothetical protein
MTSLIKPFDDREKKKLSRMILEYEEIYFGMNGVRLTHEKKDYEDFFEFVDGMMKKKNEYHCVDECCRFIMTQFIHFEPKHQARLEVRPEVYKVVVPVVGDNYEKQNSQLMKDFQIYDYEFDLNVRSISNHVDGSYSYVCEMMDGKILDCIYSTKDENISHKPFKFRRDFVSHLKCPLLMPSKKKGGNKLFVIDSFPYEQGRIGGYFEYIKDPVIFTRKIIVEGISKYCVKGSMATQREWTSIAIDETGETIPNLYYAYNYVLKQEMYVVDYSHSIYDWEMIKRNNFKLSNNKTFKENTKKGKFYLEDYEITYSGNVIGAGMRRNIYDISLGWPVLGTLYNSKDVIKSSVSLPDSHGTSYCDMIERYCRYREIKVLIVKGKTRKKKELVEVQRWDLVIGQDIT